MTKSSASLIPGSSAEVAAQFLTFLLAEGVYAMDIVTVREIIQYRSVTPVPLMPDFVRGVINLRGAVVPVIDLQARLGKPPGVVGKKTCIVIFNGLHDGERVELGLMVDAVSEVVDIAPSQIEAAPQFGTSVRRDFIRGIGKLGGRFILVLEPDRALNVDEMASLVERSQGSPAAALAEHVKD
jgi:purine-binding chemotaxis protein CheW